MCNDLFSIKSKSANSFVTFITHVLLVINMVIFRQAGFVVRSINRGTLFIQGHFHYIPEIGGSID